MGTGYTRQSAADIVDGELILAGPLNTELNQLESAFNGTTGHTHDGTVGEGPQLDFAISITGNDDLLAIEALVGTSGGLFKTAANTWALRTLTAPAAGFTITNPAGVAGDPTFVLADDLAALEGMSGTGIVSRTASNTYAQRSLSAPAAGFTITNPAGIAGDPTFVLADDLAALEGMSGTGLVARTAANTYAQRTLTAPAAGISVTNGSGVSGNPTLALANDLSALEGLASTGIAVRSTTDTWVQRTITGTSNQITSTNGDGVSGNPTLSIPSTFILPGTLDVTGATILPVTSDGTALGSGTKMFSDLFLASGAVINFNNGNTTITHSSNLLRFSTAAYIGEGLPDAAFVVPISSAVANLTAGHKVEWRFGKAESLNNGAIFRYNHSGDGSASNRAELGFYGGTDALYWTPAGIVQVNGSSIQPVTNDGSALGTATLSWSDLYLASGSVINWANGDITLTHSANQLIFQGATNGIFFDDNVYPYGDDSAALGNAFNGWSDLFLASGAVINFANSDVTVTHSADTLTFAGAASGYKFGGGPIVPTTSDGAALGTSSLMFSDLFLASGAVVNFNNGDVLITHSSDLLEVTGGDFRARRYTSVAEFTLADDAATSFDLSALGFGSGFHTVLLTNRSGIGSGAYGLFMIRVTTSPAAGSISIGSNLNLTTGILSGTTSTDTKLNVGPHTDGKLYIENRTGGSVTLSLTFF